MKEPLLKIENLRIELALRGGQTPVIDDLSLELNAGETLSLWRERLRQIHDSLGDHGTAARRVGSVASGRILFDGRDMARMNDTELRAIRGNEISMIFQEPMTSLNPVYTVGEQIAEVLRRHKGMNKAQAWSRATELLDAVRIPNAKSRVGDYPHQMSGGQRQRVMIAIALACSPKNPHCR